jgi:hypothetical protein
MTKGVAFATISAYHPDSDGGSYVFPVLPSEFLPTSDLERFLQSTGENTMTITVDAIVKAPFAMVWSV